jgi:putative acetyltransferase
MFKIRPEKPEDFTKIRDLIVQVFRETYGSGPAEAKLVEDLRLMDSYKPDLSLVAVHEDKIVGHIMFSRVHIISNERKIEALALAPLGVYKQYQRQGIGANLVKEGLETGRNMGYGAVFVQGDPRYYRRFGFGPASSRGLITPFPKVPDPDNMVLELRDGSLSGISGDVEYPKAWDPFQ